MSIANTLNVNKYQLKLTDFSNLAAAKGTMAGGTLVVSYPIGANDVILANSSDAGVVGALRIAARNIPACTFTIASSVGGDAGPLNYWIIKRS